MIHEPNPLSDELKHRIVERKKYVNKGGKISCGHDFWKIAKNKPCGDVFLCTRCAQYFVKMEGLPWLIDGKYPRTNHLKHSVCFHPVNFRLQDSHGNNLD